MQKDVIIMQNDNKNENKMQYMPIFMSIGLSVGLAIGAATNNISVGMCIGLGFGMCIGTAIDMLNRRKAENATSSDAEESENKVENNENIGETKVEE